MLLILATAIGMPVAQAAGLTLNVHPSQNLDPNGRIVTVIGKGFPANATVQLAECTGTPLTCQALVDVSTDKHGMFVSRVLVAFYFSVLNPIHTTLTCSEPTFTGDECLLSAATTESPFVSASEPITFSQ
jgi:hypothetical protein